MKSSMKSQGNNGCFDLSPQPLPHKGGGVASREPHPQPLSTRRWVERIASRDIRGATPLSMWRGVGGEVLCLLLLLFLFSPPLLCFSQEPPIPLTYRNIMVGFGTSSVYDTYLSPLKYTGDNMGLVYEQAKNTGLLNGNISAQHLFNANYSWSKNNAGTASYYSGIVEYNYGLHYRFKPVEKWQFFAGMQAGGLLGFVYNTRNDNNPATGKAHLNLSLSGIANYKLQLCKQPILFRDQVGIPFVGALYSPQYGESYYEISLGDASHLVHLASFNNYLSLRNMLSAEFPFNNFTLRLAYSFSYYETRINSLDTRLITNTFYIGFSQNFFVVSEKHKKNNYRYVFE